MTEWIVEPISDALGARVSGVDLSNPRDPSTLNRLTELLKQYLVLALQDQSLEPDVHVEFGDHFGVPLVHPFLEPIDGHPEILRVIKEPSELETFGGEHWHADITFAQPPASVSLLQSLELPPSGGDTLFANQYMALDALPADVQAEIKNLNAVHTYPGMTEEDPNASAIHPVVRVHPLTGRPALFVNPAFVTRFENMTAGESRQLLEYLFAHQISEEFRCAVSWSDPMLCLWDNRAVLHYATNDYYGYRRALQRVTAMERVSQLV